MSLFIFSNGGDQLDFLNNINYFSFYNHSIVSFITNVASIHLSQYDDISIDDYYATMIQILLNCSFSFEDIYFSIACYLLSQKDEIETDMDIVRHIVFLIHQGQQEMQMIQQLVNLPPIIVHIGQNEMGEMGEMGEMEDVRLTVPREELDKIPLVDFSDLQTDEKACSICLDEFEQNSTIRKITCGHLFHVECIDKWLTENSYKCPVCRSEIAKHNAQLS